MRLYLPQILHRSGPSLPAPIPAPVEPPTTSLPPTGQPNAWGIPQVFSGRVRHPKGSAPLKNAPESKAIDLAFISNGTALRIVGNEGGWYRVQGIGVEGFMHDTWVNVDQFEQGNFGNRYIQIASFDNYAEAAAFVGRSRTPAAAYLVTNGWYAVTLAETYEASEAQTLSRFLKESGIFPRTSFPTYGNTYVRKVCCG